MNPKELRTVLARLSLAGLIAAGGVMITSCATSYDAGNGKENRSSEKESTSSGSGKHTGHGGGGGTSCG